MSNNVLANQLKDLSIDYAILYTALRSISSGCLLSWKKEKSYFIRLLHEIPTGMFAHLVYLNGQTLPCSLLLM
jgi:hypothetical protein